MWSVASMVLVCVLVPFFVRCLVVWRTPRRKPVEERRVLVVLGSGGHTGEMVGALGAFPRSKWAKKTVLYVVSATDKDSADVAKGFEMAHLGREARIRRIPRAREVGQSYFSSVFSTIRALGASFAVVWDFDPDTILTNGPGVCIPVVGAAYTIAVLFLGRSRPKMVYMESLTCLSHVSLSGKIMLRLADRFTVQWPYLRETLRVRKGFLHVEYAGPFPHGPSRSQPIPRPLFQTPAKGGPPLFGFGRDARTAVVTVGSTKFDELISAVNQPSFYDALQQLGINRVVVQKGRSTVAVDGPYPTRLFTREVFDYKPNLVTLLRQASLVISHAGAGTITECLSARVPTIVVPNTRLMSNHQEELAHALERRRYLIAATPDTLVERLTEGPWCSLLEYPKVNADALGKFVLPFLE